MGPFEDHAAITFVLLLAAMLGWGAVCYHFGAGP
jgi:hypothetical protein